MGTVPDRQGGDDDAGRPTVVHGDEYLIVVPVLDEAPSLPPLLEELRGLGLLERTLFVDNGSADDSAGIIARAGGVVLHEARRGYAFPCLTGAREAAARGARVIVFMEADGTDDPAEAPLLASPVLHGEADLIAGSRRRAVLGCAEGRMPRHQRLGNLCLGLSLRLFFGLSLLDDAPFRAVRADLLEHLRAEPRPYAFPSEILAKARLAGARVAVREVRYRPRRGASKIAGSWRGSFGAVRDITWCLVRLRLLGLRG